MTLDHGTGEVTLDRLGPADLTETFGFLDHDPVLNVYVLALTLRDALAQTRDEMWAARRDGEIVSLLHIGGQTGAVLPVGTDGHAMELLAQQALERVPYLPRRLHVIGPLAAVEVFHRRFLDASVHPRVLRRQVYLSLQREDLPPFERLPQLRPASKSDYDMVFESGALLRAEELEEDPRVSDPIAYARRVEEECRDGYSYLWTDETGLIFRASMSARTGDAVQISGVYTPAHLRRRGIARRALSELVHRLLEKSRAACLFVNDFNAPALALYRRMGFRHLSDWGSAFYDLR